MQRVIIIGSGIGGLCTGIRLQKQGFKVSIYEQQDKAGGVTASLASPSGSYDRFASIGIHPDDYKKVFIESGLNSKDYYEEIWLEDLYHVFYADGSSFTFKKRLEENKDGFEAFFNEPFEHYEKFINDFYRKYKLADEALLRRPLDQLSNTLSPKTLLSTLKLNPLHSASAAIKNAVKSRKLQDYLLFQVFYMGFPPCKISQLYATVPAATQKLGLVHIKGGMGAYINALEKAFCDLGGKIYYNHPVSYILIKENKAYGIVTKNQARRADYIVSNADYSYTASHLIDTQVSNLSHYEPSMSCSVFMLHLSLSSKLDQLSTHNLYIPPQFESSLASTVKGFIPKQPPVYIYYPAAIDESFAPSGHPTLNMMIRVPNLSFSQVEWTPQLINDLRAICYAVLAKVSGLPHLSDLVLEERISTPVDLLRDYNCCQGAAFGLAPTHLQSAFFRPQSASHKIKDLYFVGSSIHPGNGISIVMKGAKITADLISHIKKVD